MLVNMILFRILGCVDSEAVLSVGCSKDDGVLGVLLDMAGVDHLAEDLARGLALGCLFLEHTHSSLQFFQLRQLAIGLCLFKEVPGLVVLNLLLGPAPLRAHLHHIGGDALGH